MDGWISLSAGLLFSHEAMSTKDGRIYYVNIPDAFDKLVRGMLVVPAFRQIPHIIDTKVVKEIPLSFSYKPQHRLALG